MALLLDSTEPALREKLLQLACAELHKHSKLHWVGAIDFRDPPALHFVFSGRAEKGLTTPVVVSESFTMTLDSIHELPDNIAEISARLAQRVEQHTEEVMRRTFFGRVVDFFRGGSR